MIKAMGEDNAYPEIKEVYKNIANEIILRKNRNERDATIVVMEFTFLHTNLINFEKDYINK